MCIVHQIYWTFVQITTVDLLYFQPFQLFLQVKEDTWYLGDIHKFAYKCLM